MSISPKLANSTPADERFAARHEAIRHQPEVLKRLTSEYIYHLKFVVTAPADLEEIRTVLKEANVGFDHVLLMPEGTSPERMRERGQWLAEICKREGFRYSPRLHVDLWGDRRGV
jgi:7-carboxy-7-deazaguanine synthase